MAKLYFKYGAMNCGKSIDLMRTAYNYEEMGKTVLVLKPKKDTKNLDKLESRIGLERKVDALISKNQLVLPIVINKIKQNTACILIDEAQFLTKNQVDNLFLITKKLDIPVLCYGLRVNFQSEAFEGSRRLLEIADKLEEIKTLCHCGKIARFSARKVDGQYVLEGNETVIDGSDKSVEYVPLCAECYLKNVKGLNLDRNL